MHSWKIYTTVIDGPRQQSLREMSSLNFGQFITARPHGLVKKNSFNSNPLSFLKLLYTLMKNSFEIEMVTVFTDSLRSFDKLTHLELLENVAKNGVGDCLIEVLLKLTMSPVTNVQIQGSLLGPVLFCIYKTVILSGSIFWLLLQAARSREIPEYNRTMRMAIEWQILIKHRVFNVQPFFL